MYEWVDDRLEQALRAPGILSDPANQARLHHRRHAHHDEEPSADRELALEALVGYGQRSGNCDCVVTRIRIEPGRILRDDVHVPESKGRDVAPGELRELREELQRAHRCAAGPQACRYEPRAGADLEHPLAAPEREGLKESADDAGPQHVLAARQWNLHVREGQEAVLRRDECLPRHLAQNLERPRVEHVPRTHLLLNHLLACLHRRHLVWRSDWTYCLPGAGHVKLRVFAASAKPLCDEIW